MLLQMDQPIRLQYSHQIKLFCDTLMTNDIRLVSCQVSFHSSLTIQSYTGQLKILTAIGQHLLVGTWFQIIGSSLNNYIISVFH
jgi:hypothetical protein